MTDQPEIAPGIIVNVPDGFGKPIIKGSSVEVAFVLERLADGETLDSLKKRIGLSKKAILAALAYAAEIIADEPPSRDNAVRELTPGITADGRVRFGKPVIKGTRVDAATVLHDLAAGDSVDEAAEAYGVTRDGVLAALRYARQVITRETVSTV